MFTLLAAAAWCLYFKWWRLVWWLCVCLRTIWVHERSTQHKHIEGYIPYVMYVWLCVLREQFGQFDLCRIHYAFICVGPSVLRDRTRDTGESRPFFFVCQYIFLVTAAAASMRASASRLACSFEYTTCHAVCIIIISAFCVSATWPVSIF